MPESQLRFDVDEAGDTLVISVRGEIDMLTAPRFAAVLDVANASPSRLVLDMSAVSYIDSTGLRVLMTVHKARGEQRRIHLQGASEQLRKLLAITRFDGCVMLDDPVG